MNSKYNAFVTTMLTLPIIVFIICWIVMGLPTTTVVSAGTFKFQYIVTILTIVLIPLLLWYIRPDRIGEQYPKYCIARMIVLEMLTLLDILAYFAVPNVAFFYLAVITYLSMYFARK